MDHKVELQKWLQGKQRMQFTELVAYFLGHPKLGGQSQSKCGLAELVGQYGSLSKAVHASAKQFRMTTDLLSPKLWVKDPIALAKWSTNERVTVLGINALLLHLFNEQLSGARNLPLRAVLGLVIPKTRHADIKKRLGVSIP
jgi:hypothetical protein